jgi:glyceraldehyde 3-phosphate dehydrogenase
MGRLALRAAWESPAVDFVHINDCEASPEVSAHLTEFDSVHGRWSRRAEAIGDALLIDGKRVGYSKHDQPGAVAWEEAGVDLVLECSGAFRTPETLAPYFEHGVKKVLVSAPVKTGAVNIVMGVNQHEYHPERHHIITAASCTTNCIAPVVKVLHEQIGIEHGVITTIHDVTNTQRIVDRAHKDLRRARSALMSMIPTTTGSATAITMIYPELEGKLNGLAVRVPLLNASLTDCVFELSRQTTVDEVNGLFETASKSPELEGILGYESRPLVSIDYRDDPRSGIVDGLSTLVVDGTQVKVLVWYDSEFGYVQRMVELMQLIVDGLA